jgi:uncharacterized membrane protein YidH (DUF202 family)
MVGKLTLISFLVALSLLALMGGSLFISQPKNVVTRFMYKHGTAAPFIAIMLLCVFMVLMNVGFSVYRYVLSNNF